MKRLSVCFDDIAIDAFEDIKRATGITVIADIIRQALTVLMALLEAERRGCQIIMKSENGQQFRYSLARPTEMIEIKGGPEELPNPIDLTRSPKAGSVPKIKAKKAINTRKSRVGSNAQSIVKKPGRKNRTQTRAKAGKTVVCG